MKAKRGRPRKISAKNHVKLKAMRRSNIPISQIASKMKVTEVTVRRYLSLPLSATA